MIAVMFIFYSKREVALQTKLMKTLLRVATKYQTVLLSNAFPSSLLDPLLRMSMACDPNIRKIVQEILHTLIDRHGNKPRLRLVKYFTFFLNSSLFPAPSFFLPYQVSLFPPHKYIVCQSLVFYTNFFINYYYTVE